MCGQNFYFHMSADLGVLTKIAISKLTGTKPKGWNTDARELFDSTVVHSHPDTPKDIIEAAWRDGMAHMRDNFKDEWDIYVKSVGRPQDANATSWDKVILLKGHADGDSFELHFDVDGEKCVIECTDAQLLDPGFIQRKLIMYTRKDVSCPYLGKKQLEAWRRNVVIPWLKSAAFQLIERETMSQNVENLVREYCADTIDAATGPDVWLQGKRAVHDAGFVYVPFPGLQDFIGKRSSNDPTKRTVKHTLSRLGFSVVMKGKSRLRFHCIATDKIYEKTDPSETGRGQIDADSSNSGEDSTSGRDSVLDFIRAQERERPETESGERPTPVQDPF